jgi:hypothetical protein
MQKIRRKPSRNQKPVGGFFQLGSRDTRGQERLVQHSQRGDACSGRRGQTRLLERHGSVLFSSAHQPAASHQTINRYWGAMIVKLNDATCRQLIRGKRNRHENSRRKPMTSLNRSARSHPVENGDWRWSPLIRYDDRRSVPGIASSLTQAVQTPSSAKSSHWAECRRAAPTWARIIMIPDDRWRTIRTADCIDEPTTAPAMSRSRCRFK